MEDIREISMQQRAQNLSKLTENQVFMKDWQAAGKRNWKQNQSRRRESIARVRYFEDREVNIHKLKIKTEIARGAEEAMEGIRELEENLDRLGI